MTCRICDHTRFIASISSLMHDSWGEVVAHGVPVSPLPCFASGFNNEYGCASRFVAAIYAANDAFSGRLMRVRCQSCLAFHQLILRRLVL